MSELAERAIVFYLAHPNWLMKQKKHTMVEIIKFDCPKCEVSVVIQEGKWFPGGQPGVIAQEQLPDEVPQSETEQEEAVSSLLVSKT